MAVFRPRSTRGVTATYASKKRDRSLPQRFDCPCGCGKRGWFTQPRSLRVASIAAMTESDGSS